MKSVEMNDDDDYYCRAGPFFHVTFNKHTHTHTNEICLLVFCFDIQLPRPTNDHNRSIDCNISTVFNNQIIIIDLTIQTMTTTSCFFSNIGMFFFSIDVPSLRFFFAICVCLFLSKILKFPQLISKVMKE